MIEMFMLENLLMSHKTKRQIHDLRCVTFKKDYMHLPLALTMTGIKINTSLQISSYRITVVLLFTLD